MCHKAQEQVKKTKGKESSTTVLSRLPKVQHGLSCSKLKKTPPTEFQVRQRTRNYQGVNEKGRVSEKEKRGLRENKEDL